MTSLLDSRRGRLRAAALLGLNAGVTTAHALSGDPQAQLLRGSPRTDVYAAHERLRGRGEVVRSRLGVVSVTSHALCQQVLRDPHFGQQMPESWSATAAPLDIAANGPLAGSFLELDPPDHTRLRRVAAPAFRPKVIRELAPGIEALLEGLLDRAGRHGSFDLMSEVAAPFPIAVISQLLGIPAEDTAQFRRVGQLVGQSLDGVRTVRQAQRLRQASVELEALFRRLAEQRRVDPGEDVISQLAAAESDGRLVARDLTATCGLLLVAGFETTVNLIGNGVAALLGPAGRGRQTWEALARPKPTVDAGLAARVTEETLRWDPPVQLTSRVAQRDTELAGRPVAAGTMVLTWLAAANRDPAVYARPATFDADREGEPEHLSFSGGIHYCLGAPLARLEGELALGALAARMPRLRLLSGARRRSGATIRGYARLPVAVG